ncbi:MAG: M4 family metallopeptidase [bacterium]
MRRPSSNAPAVHTIVPPHVFDQLATLSPSRWPGLAERAQVNMQAAAAVRFERAAFLATAAVPTNGARSVHDAEHDSRLPGRTVRREGEPASGDVAVDEAYDGLGATREYYRQVHARDSIDGDGQALVATVHYLHDFDNAFWNGRQMVFGDGDGEIFTRFTRPLEVIGHELAHGVTQAEAALVYEGQSGALNEHMSDVFGVLVKQFALGQTAREADWLVGAGLWAPGVNGTALRSMAAPGTAYDDPRIGRDPQPAHMRDYVDTMRDNGGVHINSGIPNHAFWIASQTFDGFAWQHAGPAWYEALTNMLSPMADFRDAARATVDAAAAQAGLDAARVVRAAWEAVGVRTTARRRTRRVAEPERRQA